jgi:hypothetical protein
MLLLAFGRLGYSAGFYNVGAFWRPAPVLNWDFTATASLPSQLTFTRASIATYFDNTGTMQTAAVNTPRFDHDPISHQQLGMMMESSATNLISCSANFSLNNCWWNDSSGLTVTQNAATAPDGSNAGALISSTSSGWIYPTVQPTTNGTPYTYSIYMKAATAGTVDMAIQEDGGSFTDYGFVTVNVTTSWQRFSVTANSAGSHGIRGVVVLEESLTSAYIWGAQFEAGSYPSSYIPTTTTSVTRSADAATFNTMGWYNPVVGTLLAEYMNLGSENSATYQIFGVFNTNVAGTFTQNEIDLSDSGTSVKSSVTTSGSAVFNPGGTLNGVGVVNREVLSYAAANYAFSLNHGTSTSATSGALPSAAAYAYIGSQPDGNIRDRYIRKIQYYAQKLNADYIQPL